MGVLLLNVTNVPLRVISFKRAVGLVLKEKADIVAAQDNPIISSAGDPVMDRPDVIRMNYFVLVPFKSLVPLNNKAVLNRDGFICVYCGNKATTVDHVHPRSRGGRHEWDNVVAACRRCNGIKSDKLLKDMPGWELPGKPKPPDASKWIVLTHKPRESWGQWLERGTDT